MKRRHVARTYRVGALLFAGCLFACGFLIALHAAVLAGRSLHPSRQPVVRPKSTENWTTMRNVSFTTSDRLTMRGWYIPSRNHAAVILTHGLLANRTQMIFEAQTLVDAGFGVLLYDSRGQGESDGDLVTWGDRESRDMIAAIGFVEAQPDVSPDRIGAVGCSMGGFVLADIAPTQPRLRAIAVSAMYTSLEDNIRSDYSRWGFFSQQPALWAFRHAGVNVDAVRPIDAVAGIAPRPILFLNGKNDPDSPVWAQDALYKAARAPKYRWDIDGVEYGNLGAAEPAAYRDKLVTFFRANLLGPPPIATSFHPGNAPIRRSR